MNRMKMLLIGGMIAAVPFFLLVGQTERQPQLVPANNGLIGILAVQASRAPDYPSPFGAHLLHLVPEEGQDILFIWENGCWRGFSALSEELILSRGDLEVNLRLIPGKEGGPWDIQINDELFQPRSGNVFYVSCQGELKEIDRKVTGPQTKEVYWDLIDAVFEKSSKPNKPEVGNGENGSREEQSP